MTIRILVSHRAKADDCFIVCSVKQEDENEDEGDDEVSKGDEECKEMAETNGVDVEKSLFMIVMAIDA